MLIDDALALYADHVSRLRTARETKRLLRGQLLPHITGRPLTDIRRRDMLTALDTAALRGTSNAHHVFAQARAFFNWCCSRDLIDHSPCDRLSSHRLLGPPDIRTRVLSDAELDAIWRASGLLGSFGLMIRILTLTAQRRSEVAGMRWSELSGLESEGAGLWTIEAARYKSAVQQRIPLSTLAVSLLVARPRECELVFPSRTQTVKSGFSKMKDRLDKLSGVEGWVMHDLRRTARTGMAALGVSDTVAELCLGHGKRGLARVYNQHAFTNEMRDAFEKWSSWLSADRR
jgi:integrase